MFFKKKTSFEKYFGNSIKVVNELVEKKSKKYPMLELPKIKQFLLTWTKHHLSTDEKINLKQAFYMALVTFETTCNLAEQRKPGCTVNG